MRALEVVMMTLAGVWQGLRQDFNLLEIALIVLGFWLWKRRVKFSVGRTPWSAASPQARPIVIIVGAIALRLALIPLLHVPRPIVSDEFSHLLLADTLAHGHVANPTHPFWPHFESLHIVQQPHYVSNYFPGHALFLAAAQIAIGSPWAGVLFECALFLALLYWMLRGWMPARWALFGLVLAALRFSIGSYWINALHGGFLPAAGGALIAGAFPRLRENPKSWINGLTMGLGLATLVFTRPFEGFFFATPFLMVLLWKRTWALAPAVTLAGLAVAGLCVYFKQVTGSPFVSAYQISQKTYGWPMGFAWREPPRIEHSHIELKRYYDYELGEREKVDGPIHFVEYLTFRVQEYWRFFIGPILSIPLLMLARVWRRQRMLFIGLAGALAAVMMEGAASPHYIAPATCVIVAILVECCRHLRAARFPVAILPAAMVLVLVLRIGAQNVGLPYTQELNFQSWCCRVEGNPNKARIAQELAAMPGDHLVLVKAKTDEMNLFQWIYNGADIDGSRIVWARDLGEERNARLMQYFAQRRVWIVDPNVEPATCVPLRNQLSDGISSARR
jgi:hypothetical protein